MLRRSKVPVTTWNLPYHLKRHGSKLNEHGINDSQRQLHELLFSAVPFDKYFT